MNDAALLQLLTFTSPAFPVGSFAYSHGLEWAVEAGAVRDAPSLREWLRDLTRRGAARTDTILVACAWRAAAREDLPALFDLAETAAALAGSRERHHETVTLGAAFAAAVEVAWPTPILVALAERHAALGLPGPPYPIAVGAAAGARGVPLRPTLTAVLHAFLANLIGAAARLVPLGQSDCLRALAGLEAEMIEAVAAAESGTLEDLGSACLRGDLASMLHETQYTRLFRT
jgi:urease accessory protein